MKLGVLEQLEKDLRDLRATLTRLILYAIDCEATAKKRHETTLRQIHRVLEAVRSLAPESAATFQFLLEGKVITMLDLTATQQSVLKLSIKSKSGKPAKVDGAPKWSSSDTEVATVEAASDGMSATVKAVNGNGGVCQITAAGDADLGAGVEPLTGFLDVTVAGGDGLKAAVFELIAGTPTEQPA